MAQQGGFVGEQQEQGYALERAPDASFLHVQLFRNRFILAGSEVSEKRSRYGHRQANTGLNRCETHHASKNGLQIGCRDKNRDRSSRGQPHPRLSINLITG